MLILKPAKSNADTPWHQDEAFCDPKFEHKEITFWMPLQDATEENGCMSFIEGSHTGSVLSHHSPSDDPTVHALECCGDFEPSEAVTCPLPVGSCSVHYGRTLHSAGGNRSDQPRYAYILGFHVPPTPSVEERNFPWLAEKRTGDSALTKAWLLRGGLISIALRKIRRGEFFTWHGLRYSIRRTVSVLFN
jgi:ectoine hydroxylase-related dioxygenase (phytanoyl-CoA dioxygenase family)